MLLSKFVEGYFYDKSTTYNKATLTTYQFVFHNLIDFLGDKEVTEVTPDDLKRFINWLRDDFKPTRSSGDTSPLAPASVDLHWKGVCSLFNWANDELNIPRPDLKMPRPSFKRAHSRS